MARFSAKAQSDGELRDQHNVLVDQLNNYAAGAGTVLSTGSFTTGNFIMSNSTDGTSIKDSGYSAASFVPVASLSTTRNTWNPSVEGSLTTGSYAYGTQSGSYYRVGNICFITGRFTIKTITSAGTGDIHIKTLPYTSRAINYAGECAMGWNNYTLPASKTMATVLIGNNADYGVIYASQSGSGGALGQMSGLSTATDIHFSGMYEIST